MLPSLGLRGWRCVARADAFVVEAAWDSAPAVIAATAQPDQVTFVIDGHLLEIPLEGFAHLFSTLMIAAHARPASD